MEEMTREDWAQYVRRHHQEDLQTLPKLGKELTPDVALNAFQLIVAVSCDGILGRKINTNILEFYLSGKISFNN